MLPEKDEAAETIFVLGFVICTIFSIICLIIIITFHEKILNALNARALGNWLYVLPISIFLSGTYSLLNYYNTRKAFYNDIAKANIYKSIILCSVQLIAGLLKVGHSGLVNAQVASQLTANLKLLKSIFHKVSFKKSLNRHKITEAIWSHIKFPLYSLPSDLLHAVSTQLPVILFASVFGSTTVGFFVFAQKVISFPVTLIATSVGQIYFREATKIADNEEKLKEFTSKIFLTLVYIGTLPFSILVIFSQEIFLLAFGAQWVTAGQYSELLAIWMFLVFVGMPISNLASMLDKQQYLLFFNVGLFISRALALFIGCIILNNPYLAVLFYSLAGFILWSGWITYMLRLASVRLHTVLVKTTLVVGPTLILLSMLKQLI